MASSHLTFTLIRTFTYNPTLSNNLSLSSILVLLPLLYHIITLMGTSSFTLPLFTSQRCLTNTLNTLITALITTLITHLSP